MNPLELLANALKRKLNYHDGDATEAMRRLGEALRNPIPTGTASQLDRAAQLRQQPGSLRPNLTNQQLAQEGMNIAGFAPMGMTVYHGSPHKFDRFDFSKIGTGEGAQAYGHGGYYAETPEVAQTYKQSADWRQKTSDQMRYLVDGQEVSPKGIDDGLLYHYRMSAPELFNERITHLNNQRAGSIERANYYNEQAKLGEDPERYARMAARSLDEAKRYADELSLAESLKGAKVEPAGGYLYKADIPDEAVARMLDWDKPLSEQAPEVQALFNNMRNDPGALNSALNGADAFSMRQLAKKLQGDPSGEQMYGALKNPFARNALGFDNWSTSGPSEYLKSQGIPGIRYLDGGSRSAGEGTSNFVLFDDQLPRILERNGVPTGLEPWKPGEANELLGLPPLPHSPKASDEIPGQLAQLLASPPDSPQGMPDMPAPRSGAMLPYQIDHKPMTVAGGAATLDDLVPAFGEDVYGRNALQYFGSGDAREAAALALMRKVRGNPNAMVDIYRGVPEGIDKINPGDWVTLSPDVAADYGSVIKQRVPASHITSWPDSLLEYGYFPPEAPRRPVNALGQEIPPTPYELAHQVAQRNAALPVEQGGLGLPPNNTYIDRANAMYRQNVWHGQRPNEPRREYFGEGLGSMLHEPAPLEPIERITQGAGNGEGGAFFMSDDLGVGNGYANKTGAVYPLRVNPEDFKVSGVAQDFPVNGTEAEKDAFMREVDRFNRGLDKNKNRYFRNEISDAKSAGNGGVVFKNVEDSSGSPVYDYPSDVYAAFGAPVRSRFAAFDPMKRDSADLLAGLGVPVASTSLLAALLANPQDAQAK